MTQAKPPAETLDLYRESPAFFHATRKPELVELPEAGFLVVDGEGAPGSEAFQDAVGALYSVAYTLKMTGKKHGRDFKVPTFEGAWWWIDSDGRELPREQWRWQLLMMMPDFVATDNIEDAKAELARKKKALKTSVRFERIRQGTCVQILHVGPYATEAESIERMKAFMAERGLRPNGPHHEVYLGDPRRAKPEALKTILKQPVAKI